MNAKQFVYNPNHYEEQKDKIATEEIYKNRNRNNNEGVIDDYTTYK